MPLYVKAFLENITKDGDFAVLASNNVIDREGESINPQGWVIDNFLKNPVILWAHRYDELPIGVAEKVEKRADGLFVSGRFASFEANPKATQVKKLYEEGIQRAVSVGLIPLKRNGNVITEAELLEISFVPVPANPEALALAKQKGIDESLFEPIDRVLSKNAQELVRTTAESMKKSLSALEALLSATKPPAIGECAEGTAKQKSGRDPEGADVIEIPIVELLELRRQLRLNTKHDELILSVVNRVLSASRKK